MDPKELLNNPEQIQNLISILQSLLPSSVEQTQEKTKSSKTKNKKLENTEENNKEEKFTSKIKTRNRRPVESKTTNKFEKMQEFSMHKDDVAVDEKLAKHPPVARTRDFEPISVICRICGKKEIVSPSLVYEGPSRYKCNNCSTQAG